MSVEQKLCEMRKNQPHSISNAIACIEKRFVVKSSGISCLALMEQSENDSPAVKKSVQDCEI